MTLTIYFTESLIVVAGVFLTVVLVKTIREIFF